MTVTPHDLAVSALSDAGLDPAHAHDLAAEIQDVIDGYIADKRGLSESARLAAAVDRCKGRKPDTGISFLNGMTIGEDVIRDACDGEAPGAGT